MRSLLIVLSAVSALLVSCSIKEDRSECPCRLRLDLSPVDANVVGGKLLLSIRNEDGFSYSDTVDLSVGTGLLEVKVPRTGVRVNLWSCEAADFVGEDGLVIPFGDECPSVRMFSSYVDTDCETCTETVGIIKNYCRLTVMMDESDKYWPYELNVSGNIDGYRIDGTPRTGEFSHYLVPPDEVSSTKKEAQLPRLEDNLPGNREAALVRELSLPRQKDASLKLSVLEKTSVLKTFALGNYICQSGYDWTAENLQDIVVKIDYACTRVSIVVGPWEHSYDVDIEF